MELAEIRLFEPQMAEIDLFTMPDAVGVGEPSVRKVKPYISGHINDGSSTFTFKVNGNDVTVSVSGGDWKYKPTAAITSLAFVSVPQLESLELNKITGVSTFNLDYPVVPVFKKCDATTEAALNYVYHIRGTATDDFDFTLKYIDDNNTVTTVTENAVIDGNGKWDVSYSGKKIYDMTDTFASNTIVESIELTEAMKENISMSGTFNMCKNLEYFLSKNATWDKTNNINRLFRRCYSIKNIDFGKNPTFKCIGFSQLGAYQMFYDCNELISIDGLGGATFEESATFYMMFNNCKKLTTLQLHSINISNSEQSSQMFSSCNSLSELYIPQDSSNELSQDLRWSPLTYDSMLRVAGWLKDLSGGTAQTVTFKADTYNALSAEQKAEVEGIIVTQKGWILATA